MNTVGIRFKPAGKVYTFDSAGIECKADDRVIVETERGMALGTIAWGPEEPTKLPPQKLKKILRVANEGDLERVGKNEALQKEAKDACFDLIKEKGLDMKLLSVECLFDRSKLIFYFAAEGRVDFRELVRDLARRFHTRIEMRQVGVRDEAKMIGGLGCCGRELCCATWMSEFMPISVRMAKTQNISLNPAKISGICGRLMCCLSYENKMYEQLSKGMPKVGKKVETQLGEGKVIRRNALEGTFVIIGGSGEVEVPVEDYLEYKRTGKMPEPPPQPDSQEKGPGAVDGGVKGGDAEKSEGRGRRRSGRRTSSRSGRSGGARRDEKGQENQSAGRQSKEQKGGEGRGGDEPSKSSQTGEDPSGNSKGGENNNTGSEGDRRGGQRRRRRRRRKPSQAREKKSDG